MLKIKMERLLYCVSVESVYQLSKWYVVKKQIKIIRYGCFLIMSYACCDKLDSHQLETILAEKECNIYNFKTESWIFYYRFTNSSVFVFCSLLLISCYNCQRLVSQELFIPCLNALIKVFTGTTTTKSNLKGSSMHYLTFCEHHTVMK